MKKLGMLVIGALVAIGLAEGYARFGLGLGDPPLTVRDPQIDYIFAPSRTYSRFGNQITYNAFSMRADDVAPTKQDPDELRVLVMGDSVINGGALTDDVDLATRIAQARLAKELDRPVWVGNVSAGSWGPGNLLAYTHKYGWFDADMVLIVLSSHDIADVPDFEPDLGPDFPSETPLLALEEGMSRYLPRYAEVYFQEISQHLPQLASWSQEASAKPVVQVEDDRLAEGRRLLKNLLDEARSHAPVVVVLYHLEAREFASEPSEYGRILA